MKLIESKVEVIEQQPGLDGVYKQIELAGRTCYKSEDKITEDSAKGFVDRMIGSKHGAMLEHGTVYLKGRAVYDDNGILEVPKDLFPDFFERNKYSIVRKIESEDMCNWYITTNLRVIIENNLTECLEYICEPTEIHEKRITVRFTCDRGVSHEIVRHRVMSFAQESQRYIGYDKEKFGGEITFIKPHWYDEEFPACLTWVESLKDAEQKYMDLREAGLKAQDARGVLPNATKTEIVVTGFESDWEHFFSLRSHKYGAQGVHPDMAKLADELYEKLNSVNK
jgi:thymidylate synthase (FAD)